MAVVRDSNRSALPLHLSAPAPTAPESSLDKFLNCCIPCGLFTGALVCIGAVITNMVFSIIALVETSHKELQKECPETNLWVYLLIIVILGTGNTRRTIQSSLKEDINICAILCGMIMHLGLLGWGVYELWEVNCVNDIKSNLIYTMTLINVVACLVAVLIIFSIIVFVRN
jgi:hypothetical protein